MKNIPASIQSRLRNLAQQKKIDFSIILRLYMQEGLLRRMSLSSYSRSFYLKGGLLLYSISGFTSRPTQDIDLLGTGISGNNISIHETLKSILMEQTNDGLTFNTDSITVTEITEGRDYQGKRIKVICYLGNMKNVLKIDIGFGDVIYPGPVKMDYPELLSTGHFPVYSYSMESVIAEKFHAMIILDAINSRMKDFYDVYKILTENDIPKEPLKKAIQQTFVNRHTVIPENPAIFSKEFRESPRNTILWKGYLKRINAAELSFEIVMAAIKNRLEPVYRAFKHSS